MHRNAGPMALAENVMSALQKCQAHMPEMALQEPGMLVPVY